MTFAPRIVYLPHPKMQNQLAKSRGFSNLAFELLLGVLVLIGLYLTSAYRYLLFHSLVELFTIVVSACIFVLAWNTRRFIETRYLLIIGVGALCVGALDILHTLAYAGMGVFPGETANLPTQLWIAQRYVLAGSFVLAPFLMNRRVREWPIIAGFALVTGFLALSILYWRNFPACYIDGTGLTDYKKVSEYAVAGVLLLSLGSLWTKRTAFDPKVFGWLAASIALNAVTDLVFVTYASVYDLANFAGHLLELGSFYLIYKAILETGLVKPFDLVFRDLKHKETMLEHAKVELEARVAERTADLRSANENLERELAERRKAEEQVRQLNAQLECRVAERTEQLQDANHELEAQVEELKRAQEQIAQLNTVLEKRAGELETTNQELEAFSYSVSHDLRAPLRAVGSFTQLLLDEESPQLSPESYRYLELVHRNAEEMDALVKGLLAFSRSSRQPLNKQMVHLRDMVANVWRELEVSDPAGRRIDIQIGGIPDVRADPVLIKQVWANLLSNALKFTRCREVAHIEVGSYPQENETVFFVKDNGAGFDSQNAEKLFGVFQRFHHQEEYEGTGVGLAIVARIVRRHGGRIWADAQVDQGACFSFTLA